jgi:hypothetical protein
LQCHCNPVSLAAADSAAAAPTTPLLQPLLHNLPVPVTMTSDAVQQAVPVLLVSSLASQSQLAISHIESPRASEAMALPQWVSYQALRYGSADHHQTTPTVPSAAACQQVESVSPCSGPAASCQWHRDDHRNNHASCDHSGQALSKLVGHSRQAVQNTNLSNHCISIKLMTVTTCGPF